MCIKIIISNKRHILERKCLKESKQQFDALYAPMDLNASKEQFHALAKGKNVRLNHQQIIGGKIHVYLNKSHINNLKEL